MKTIRWILVSFACCFIPPLAHAQKPQPRTAPPREPAILQDIEAFFAAQERKIETQYAKSRQEVRKQKVEVEYLIRQHQQRIEELKDSAKKLFDGVQKSAAKREIEVQIEQKVTAINREIATHEAAVIKLRDDLRKLDAELLVLEEKKQKAITELRKQKEKALAEARSAAEEKKRRG
jgi:chromosome segregation ATPase